MAKSFEMKGLDKTKKRFDEILKRLIDRREGNEMLGAMGFQNVMKHFGDERGPNGIWNRSGRAIMEGGKTLQDTGRLRGSTDWKATNNDAIIHNSVHYAIYHHEGTKKMPQRKFLWIDQATINRMAEKFLKWLIHG